MNMNRLPISILRNIPNRNSFLNPTSASQKFRFSSSSSEDEKKSSSADNNKLNEKNKSEDALKKLNNLLKTMIEEDEYSGKKLELAKPINRRKKLTEEEKRDLRKAESPEKQMENAVKQVAESFGGNVQQTESELLTKLLNTTNDTKTTNLIDLVKGMKIDNEDPAQGSRARQVGQILQNIKESQYNNKTGKTFPRITKAQPELPTEKIDLFGSPPLGIFTTKQSDCTEGVENKTWSKLYARDLKLAVTHPPTNYFQQMILWTEQGKVWKFPIDNEQGLEEEQKVYFAEHVFLEKHLEPWCPPKGPLRHFMELVCVGLSKNPYLTVEAKKGHIEWFKNYFEEKKELLKEVGALQSPQPSDQASPKQLENN